MPSRDSSSLRSFSVATEASEYREAREKYRPRQTGTLWVAESPPSGGGYFYFEKASGGNHLFRETMRALGWWPAERPMPLGFDKRALLRRFQREGHLLTDLSPFPVNHLPRGEKGATLRPRVSGLLREAALVGPKRVILVKRNVFEILYKPLREAGFEILNEGPIPFPSNGWQAEYRRGIRTLLLARQRQ